uniref:Uncharacterized protein n=1 Tax=Glossina pallidipes TaxID=7398 RepID=A0A1A9ZFN4_GLOPL
MERMGNEGRMQRITGKHYEFYLLGDHDCFYPAHSSYPSYHLSHRRRQRRRQHLHRHPFPGQALIRFARRLNDANGRDCERLSSDDLVEAVADAVAVVVAVAVAAAAAAAVAIFIKRLKSVQGFKKLFSKRMSVSVNLKKLPSYRLSSTSISMNLSMVFVVCFYLQMCMNDSELFALEWRLALSNHSINGMDDELYVITFCVNRHNKK